MVGNMCGLHPSGDACSVRFDDACKSRLDRIGGQSETEVARPDMVRATDVFGRFAQRRADASNEFYAVYESISHIDDIASAGLAPRGIAFSEDLLTFIQVCLNI